MWCIPPDQNADFVAKMEDVLAVYQRPYDEKFPVVCMDEKPFQLLDNLIPPIKMSENCHKTKEDCQYERKGSCSIFLFTEPLAGWRNALASERRTSEDWAKQVKWLLDTEYPSAEKVVLIMDNLNTHNISSTHLKKRFACHSDLKFTTHQSMVLGLILRKLNFQHLEYSVWERGGFHQLKHSTVSFPHGIQPETFLKEVLIGNLQQAMLALN